MSDEVAPSPLIESRILITRGHKVMLDADLAILYDVPTKRLNEAVSRNKERFPEDFMFRISSSEDESLRSQIAASNAGRGGRRNLPYAFTELGIAMLSSVLRSQRAIHVNMAIMRTFVRLRQLLATHEELARRLDALEWLESERDGRVQYVFETIQHLIEAPEPQPPAKKQIGFPTDQI